MLIIQKNSHRLSKIKGSPRSQGMPFIIQKFKRYEELLLIKHQVQ